MNEAIHHLGNDGSSFHPVNSLIRAVGPPDLHHAKGPGPRPDPLLSLGSGQIGGRLWRSGRRGYERQAPRCTGASTAVLGSPAGTLRCRPSARPPLGSLRTCDSRSSSPRLRTTSVDRGLFRDKVAEQIDPRKTAQPQSPDR